MTPDQQELVDKASESIEAAQLLFDTEFYGISISRSYYGMFHLAQAFLEGEELAFSKHSAVIAAFGQHFAKTGKVPVQFHRYLIEAEKDRLIADYNSVVKFSREEAEKILLQAKEFLAFTRQFENP